MREKYALVTGASSGIGYQYCQELLLLGWTIIGVARNVAPLEKLKEKYPSQVITFSYDLSIQDNVYDLFRSVNKYRISLLINNAGFANYGSYNKVNIDADLNLIDLNIKTVLLLTKLFLEKFTKENIIGRVLNVGSLVSFTPSPFLSSYAASKAYVLNYSVALNTELKKQKSLNRVICICPGVLTTNFWKRANFKKPTKKMIGEMSVEKFAHKSLRQSLKTNRKNYIIIGLANKILWFLIKIAPQKWSTNIMYKIFR
ncbi:SDR family NAD(P)-dependent oxidoreductase [Spiroplasma sp. DGKH1]|uniref:SDR family NAD(P)-dependent oxidoreductase n=1 Tax=Spiroplasma sp. DGKH1 TaxID=3050074 RepID=UPI0034C5CA82